MKIHCLAEAPPPALAAKLERFERQFTYPLGIGRSFHISHGKDYPRFFRAIGENRAGASFVAESEGGEVLGTLGVALRPVQLPGGEVVTSAYLGDLKTAQDPRRARTLVALAARAYLWGRQGGANAAYGVVMDGTPHSPSTYSGRFGIPAFCAIGHICVLRFPMVAGGLEPDNSYEAESDTVGTLYRRLSVGRFAPFGGSTKCRSNCVPMYLAAPDGRACGVLEDTRRAKRLLLGDGSEMISCHLSRFAYADVPAGVSLLRQTLARGARQALAPALFVSVPAVDTTAFLRLLGDVPDIVQAPATIFAAGFTPSASAWNVNTAEI